DLQPAAPVRAGERRRVRDRRRLRRLDDRDAVARDQLVGAVDRVERLVAARRPRVRADRLAAIRGAAAAMTALVIIPTYNERENIPPLVEQLLPPAAVRVLVVDDQPPDGTGAAADAVARAHPSRVAVLHRTTK